MVPPVATQVPVPEVQQEIPRDAEVPIAPVGIQMNPPLVREDLLYERFRRMKVPEFEGPMDPIAADNWFIDFQVILDFMRLTEQEKVICASFALKKDARHWWMTMQMRGDVMGTMTVLEAVKKFEQLARLCSELVPNETEKVRRMMKMFWTYIAKQDKEARAQFFKTKKEEKAVVEQLQPRQNVESYSNGQTSNFAQGSKQLGRNKMKGIVTGQGQQRNYPQKKSNRGNEVLAVKAWKMLANGCQGYLANMVDKDQE
ncbi:hypothetical protein TIFTF001_054569, partial [Ficus carica]